MYQVAVALLVLVVATFKTAVALVPLKAPTLEELSADWVDGVPLRDTPTVSNFWGNVGLRHDIASLAVSVLPAPDSPDTRIDCAIGQAGSRCISEKALAATFAMCGGPVCQSSDVQRA